MSRKALNIRRIVIDVDKALRTPTLIEIAEVINSCTGVQACNITVDEVDQETVGTNITIEGEALDYDEIVRVIEQSGAVVHNLDQLVFGDRILENIVRTR